MSFLSRLLGKQVSRKVGFGVSPWESPAERDTRGFLSAYGEIYSLFGISLRIATAVSEVKWRLYKGSERSERSQIAEHPILSLLDFANEFQTGQEIMELTQLHMDLAGKAYWYLPKNVFGAPAEVWVLAPHLMKPVPSKDKFISGYIYQRGTEQILFSTDEIIRFPMPDPLNQHGGIGYAQASAVELDSESYAGKWNRNFFYNSARPDGALETDETLTEEQFEQLKSQWQSRHGGVSRAHKVAILEGGLKYKQIQMSQKDMDFEKLRNQTRENIMFAFGMPQSVMGVSKNVNRANAEAGDYTFARWLIKPRLTRMKNKLNEQLIPMFSQAKGIEIDFDEVVPQTIEQKKGLAESGVKAGWMTINEARKLNGIDPISSGDVLLIPFNMMPTPADKPIVNIPMEPKAKSLTDEQKEARWRAYILKTEKQEQKFENVFKDLLNTQEKEVLSNFYNEGNAVFDYDASVKRFKSSFQPLITFIYEDAFDEAVGEVKQADPLAVEWIEKRALDLVVSLNLTTKELLRKTMAEGFAEGESIPKIARRIKGFFEETYKGRSRMIARTEVITASAKGAEEGYKAQGVERTEWFTSLDDTVCEECEPLHGKVYPIGQGERPALHPGCRCVMLPVV